MDKEEFDIEDLINYKKLSPKEKLEHLEEMNELLLQIRPKDAQIKAK